VDAPGFDRLTAAMAARPQRRTALRWLAATVLGTALAKVSRPPMMLLPSASHVAAKGKHHKKHKKDPCPVGMSADGSTCGCPRAPCLTRVAVVPRAVRSSMGTVVLRVTCPSRMAAAQAATRSAAGLPSVAQTARRVAGIVVVRPS
jgi:hypothetical protein